MGFNSGFKGLRETELSRIQQYIYSATIEIDINYTQELAFTLSKIIQQDANMYSLLYFCKLLYMLRVVTPPIIRAHITVITVSGTGQTVSATSRDGLTIARCCNYSYKCS